MNVREFQETFSPWFDVVTKKFQGSFSEDYDINILAFLHENIDREIKIVFSSTDRLWTTVRTQSLYNVLTYLYEHILWKLRKDDFPNASLSCVKLLSQLIKTGLLLTHGLTECEYIDRILTALRLFTGKPALLYDALLLVNGLKKLHHEPYSVILRSVLKTDHKEFTDPLLYMEIILLFRRLRALSDSSDKTLYSLAKKMKPPSNLISWLVSLNVNGSISFLKLLKHKKILHQLMKKNIPETLLKTVRHIILRSYYFEESCNPHKDMIVSGNTSDLFMTDTSSLVMQEIQPTKSPRKNLKKINSKKQGEHIIKKSTKDLVSYKSLKESTISKADNDVFYIDNFSNLVIENKQSDSSDAIETHSVSSLATQTSKIVSSNIEYNNSSKKKRKSKHILKTSSHNEELNEQSDSVQENDVQFNSNLTAETSKTVSANVEECKNSSKKRRISKRITNTLLPNEELNELSNSLQEYFAIETNFISNLTAQTSKTVSANIEECKYLPKKRRKSKHMPNDSLQNEELNNYEVEVINLIDTESSDSVSNVPAKKSKKECEIDKFSVQSETPCQHIPSKRDYSENESLEYSAESEIINVKHRKKLKFTHDKIVNELIQDNCNISSESNFENLGITANEIDKSNKISPDNLVKEKDITFVAEIIRNTRKDHDVSEISKQNSVKYSETSKTLQNVADKNESTFIIDNDKLCDQQNALLENQIPSIQALVPPKLLSSDENSKKSDQNSDKLLEVAENKETSSKLSTEDTSQNTSNHSVICSTHENTDITPGKEQSTINEASQDSSHTLMPSDSYNCNTHKPVETHIENGKLSNAQSSAKNELAVKDNLIVRCTKGDQAISKTNLLSTEIDMPKDKSLDIPVKCNDSINSSYSLDKSVEDSHDELLKTESQLTQTSNKESEISYKCSDNDSTEKVISWSSENSSVSKDILEKENDLSSSNISKSQKISDLNPKITFQSDEPCNKVDSADPSINGNDAKHVDQGNLTGEIKIPDSSNTSSYVVDVIPFVEVNKNSQDTSEDDSVCNNLSKQSPNSSLITKNTESFVDENPLSSSPLSNKHMQSNFALSIVPTKEFLNEEAVNSKNCLSTDNISENFNQSIKDVECKNTASEDEVKYLEKDVPQTNSKLSELSDSNNNDFVTSSAKNTGEAALEIKTKCEISETDMKQSIKNLPTKNSTSDVKCSEISNNTEKIVSVATPSILSKTSEEVFEESLQKDSCLSEKNTNQSSLVALQNDEIIENVLPNSTDTVTKTDLESEKIAVNIILQHDENSDSLSQDHTKSENIVKDFDMDSNQNNSSNIPQSDKKLENTIQSDSIGNSSQNEACIPPQEDAKFENVFQEGDIANNSSQLNPETDSTSLNDNKSDNIIQSEKIESTGENEIFNRSQNDAKSDNSPQKKAVAENYPQQDTETVTVSQNDKNSEDVVEDCVKVQSTSQNDASQYDIKTTNTLEEDLATESSSQKDMYVSQDDANAKSVLEKDLVAESLSHDDQNLLNVPEDDNKCENMVSEDSISSTPQNESYVPQTDSTETGNVFQEEKIVKCISQIDQEIDNESQGDKIVGNTLQDAAKIESTYEKEAYNPICNKKNPKSENDTHVDEVAEKSSNNSETICGPQKDEIFENKVHVDSEIDSSYHNDDPKIINELEIDKKSQNIVQCNADQEIDNESQGDKIVENTLQDAAKIESTYEKEAYNPICNKKKSENDIHVDEVAEKSSNNSEIICGPQKDEIFENKVHVDSEIDSSYHIDDPKIINELEIDKKSENTVQCNADKETVLQNNGCMPPNDKKSENILQEDLATESSPQKDSCVDSLTQNHKNSEDLLQGDVEIINKSQNEVCSLSHKEAKFEKSFHGNIVEETSLQNPPNTDKRSEEEEKSENIFQSNMEGEISPQNEAEAHSLSQKSTKSKTISQTDIKDHNLTQDKLQSINKLQVVKEPISGCPSNTVQCDIPNLTNKTVIKDNLSSYSVLTTGSSSDICDVSMNVEDLPCTKDSVFASETDSEEIDVVNISNESESDAGVKKTECSTDNVDAIKEFPSVAENKSNCKSVKDKQLSNESIVKNALKSMPKVTLSEYTPHFCKNKDYVSFSDISLQNKNKIIVLDSGLKSPNPISNFSLAATAEIFCEYRNDILHGDKTDTLSRDDALSNTHLSDCTKSPSLSSNESDEESDSPTYSSTEDNLTNETEKTCDDKSNTEAAITSDSSSSLKNKSCPASENETDDKENVQNENECVKPSTSDEKEPKERMLVRQSLRLQIKAETKNKVCLDENPETDELSDKESKSTKESNPEVDESSDKESKSTQKAADSVSHKISSPKSMSVPCDNIISSSVSSNKSISEEKTSSQKCVSIKSISGPKKRKLRAKDCISPPKGYSLRHRKSRKLIDDSSNLGIDLTKLKLDSPSSKNTRSKSSTKDIKFAKLLTSELNSQKSLDSNELTLPRKRETRSSSTKTEPDVTQNTPGYNLRTRTSIIAPGKLKI